MIASRSGVQVPETQSCMAQMRRTERTLWRARNRFEVIANGHRFFPAMAEAIGGARDRVALEMYLVQSGPIAAVFVDALCGAAQRGVSVHLLIDDFGGRGLNRADRNRLLGAGVYFARFNPLSPFKLTYNLVRDHRKLLLVDDRCAFVGGAGLADEFGLEPDRGWRENMLRIEGECVRDWWQVFRENWRRWSGIPCHAPGPAGTGTAHGRVVAGTRAGARPLKAAAVTDIRRAQRRVWLASPYFLPPWKIRRALSHAARRKVDVRLLLPGPRTDHAFVRAATHRLYGWLLRHGVRIFEYQPAFLHAKALLADDRAMVGSCNFDRWSLRWNLEANQQIHDREFAAHLTELFEADFDSSEEITLAAWRARPRLARLRERFWGWVETVLVRASYRTLVLDQARRRGDPERPPTTLHRP